RDKLSARAIKCVFLGYSRLQKGYKCYSPSTKRHYVRADALPIPYLSPTESSSLEIHNQDILQSSSSVHCQAELSSPLMSTCQSGTQEMGTSVCEYSLDSCPLSSTDPTPDPLPSSPSHDSDVSWSIALRKALNHPRWRQVMIVEMQVLEQSGTWELISLPSIKKAFGCRWVLAIKVAPNDTVDRFKARLVAKGYTQVYVLDYGDVFSPVAKITIIRLLLAMAAIRHWPLHQLDIKNAFLHGDLDEEIYMEQPPDFVAQGESGLVCKLCRSLYGLKQSLRAWFGKFSQVVQNFGMTRSEADHFVFYCHSSFGKFVYLVVYVDDIVIIENDDIKISQLKQYLFSHFQTKDLGHLKYFLGIEIAQSKEDIIISQRKYALDILQETSVSNCRPIDSPMDPNMKLMAPCVDHWATVLRILRYINKIPGQGLLYEDKGDTHIGQDLPLIDDLLQEKLLAKEISTEFVNSSNQLADIFTKSLRGPQIQIEYLPISSVEKSKQIMEEFIEIWKEVVSKKSLAGQFMHTEPNYGEYGLSDNYTSQHTAVQYAAALAQLIQSAHYPEALDRTHS
ncbi:hypothetical protein CR513_31925, partial [Mucuna pruriens]